jgi:tRNA(Ile)-lysidine synthetase-like protein
LTVEPRPGDEAPVEAVSSLQVVEFLKEALAPSVELRSPHAADQIRVAQHGTRNVHDIMVEQRVPRRARQRWPVLVAGRTVIWVPGLAVDDHLTARPGLLAAERVRFAWRRLQK